VPSPTIAPLETGLRLAPRALQNRRLRVPALLGSLAAKDTVAMEAEPPLPAGDPCNTVLIDQMLQEVDDRAIRQLLIDLIKLRMDELLDLYINDDQAENCVLTTQLITPPQIEVVRAWLLSQVLPNLVNDSPQRRVTDRERAKLAVRLQP
jgi:hypothetical protein